VLVLGREFGHDRLRTAIMATVSLGAYDVAAVRYLLTEASLQRAPAAPIDVGEPGTLRSAAAQCRRLRHTAPLHAAPSDWNGARITLGVPGRLRRNPQIVAGMQKMVAEADSSGVLTYDRNSERRASQWPRRPERGCRRLAEVHGARLRPIQIWRIVASATGCASFPVAFALAMPSHVLPKSETAGSGSVTEAVRQALTALFHWHAFCLSGCWKQSLCPKASHRPQSRSSRTGFPAAFAGDPAIPRFAP
jgi:hypothetical protein